MSSGKHLSTKARLAAAFLLGVTAMAAHGQNAAANFPSKPVVMISPYSPGGGTERDGQLLAQFMGALLGKPFILDFKLGAAGTVATNYVARATPDGHTLLLHTTGLTVVAATKKDLPYDTLKDLAPISLIFTRPAVLLAHPSFAPNNFEEYLAYAKANPEKINFGTLGAGGLAHLVGSWMNQATGTKTTFIHYKGSGPMVVDLVAGRTQVAPQTFPAALTQVKAGKLKAIAIISTQRSPLFPGIKTVAEQGIPGFDYSAWTGLFAPAGTPAPIINKLAAEVARYARNADVIRNISADGTILVGNTPAQFRQYLQKELARWTAIVKDNGIVAGQEE